MKRPKKTLKIYRRIKEEILKHRYLPGECLPRETAFAEQLGCARDTLRGALAQLEEEQLVRRVRGKGTFVSSNLQRQRITVLLPCAGTIRSYSSFLAEQITGVMEEAGKRFCEIEMIPVSPTNDRENIDWTRLFNLTAESRVFFSSFWFSTIFDFLARSQCRIAMICDETSIPYHQEKCLANWTRLRLNNGKLLTEMISALADRGCRHPLFIMRYLNDFDNDFRKTILGHCRKQMPGLEPCLVNKPQFADQKQADEFMAKFFSRRDEYPFDSVVLDSKEIFKAIRRFDPGMWCGFINLKQQTTLPPDSRTIYSNFDHQEAGAEAVRQLMEHDYHGREIPFDGRIIVPDEK